MRIDIKYNYLIESEIKNFPNDFQIDSRRDPDSCSKKLYDDIEKIFFHGEEIKIEEGFGKSGIYYTLKMADNTLLSVDYIGPSVNWAEQKGIAQEKIRDFLKCCRTIGGHIVWERGSDLPYKVNLARGGKKGVYDRFDWTILLLKIFVENKEMSKDEFVSKACLYIPVENRDDCKIKSAFENLYHAFECSEWLSKFEFEEFCNKFKLVGSFVDYKYNVIELAPLFPILPIDYEKYINNTCNAIDLRNYYIVGKPFYVVGELFPNGGETYTREELMLEFSVKLGYDSDESIRLIETCVAKGFIIEVSENIYTR